MLVTCLVLLVAGLPGEEEYLKADAAERAARYGDAFEAYQRCAELDDALRPYAAIHWAECRAKSGDVPGAIDELRQILATFPEGPWTRMAEAHLAARLQASEQHAEAVPFYAHALGVEPQPWWMNNYAWSAAENLLEIEDTRPQACAWFRNHVENTIYIQSRLDAARILYKSPDPQDRAVAILGMIRSSAYTEAGKALMGGLLPGGGKTSAINDLAQLILSPDRENKDGGADTMWMRLWMVYNLRKQAMGKKFEEAMETCQSLVKRDPESQEAGDALWWLASYMDGYDAWKENALALYRQLPRDCPEHYRADDALYTAARMLEAAGKGAEAIEVYLQLGKSYPESAYRSQGLYNCALMRIRGGESEQAGQFFQLASQSKLGDYYGHRALERVEKDTPERRNLKIDGKSSILLPFPGHSKPLPALAKDLEKDSRIQRLQFFGRHGLEAGQWEALDLCLAQRTTKDPGPLIYALAESGFMYVAYQFANAAGWGYQDDKPTGERLRLEFPLAYWSMVKAIAKETDLDPYLILAVAKQESTFRPNLVSHAGATGVMQLMPATAKWLAGVEPNITGEHLDNLSSPKNSLRLGAYYLMQQVERFNGNLIQALAAYNAGPGNSAKWVKQFPNHDVDQFVEAIPFSETRSYVKKVLGNYTAYHSLYPPQ